MTRREIILFALLLLTLGLGAFIYYNQKNKIDDLETVNEVAGDSLQIYKNKNGNLTAEIRSFNLVNEKALLQLKTNDEAIKRLQGVVKDYSGKLQAAIVAASETSESGSGATVITGGDTIIKGDTVFIYDEYSYNWAKKWSQGSIRATRDSVFYKYKIRNEYNFTLGEERNNWFSKKEVAVKMENLNPNTITPELRSYNVSQNPKRFNLVVYGGAGISGEFKFTPQVGVGLGYTLISIK